jgi:hypothetical protein
MDRETARQQWLAWASDQTSDPAQQGRMVDAAIATMASGGGPEAASAAALAALHQPAPNQPAPPRPRAPRRLLGLDLPRLSRLDQVLVGALILTLVATVVVASVTLNLSTPHTATPTATPSSAPANKALLAFIPVAKSFVEEHRGLKFTSDVPITFLSDKDFKARIVGKQKSDTHALDVATKEFRALGLIQPGLDLGQAFGDLLSNGIVGLYDYEKKELIVRGVDLTPAVRVTLVHELTHALQDQHFKLSRMNAFHADEGSLAFRTVVEGDAVRIQKQYVLAMSKADQDAYNTASSAPVQGVDNAPQSLLLLFGFPYIAGPTFTTAVLTAHGQTALDYAFVVPPTTSAQLIHVNKYLNNDVPRAVSAPASDAKAFDSGEFGEIGLRVILWQALTDKKITQADFDQSTAGWAGDRYVAWDAASSTACVRANFAMDTYGETAAVLATARKLAAAHKGWSASIDRYYQVGLTACG